MEDLGWGDASAATTFALTMSPEELHRVFTRFRSDAEGLKRDEERDDAEAEDEAWEFRNRAKRVTEVCERVLNIVGREPPQELAGRENRGAS